jgi:hypothetical protein
MHEAHWLTEQFTLGNVVTVLSLALSVGWQLHRLTQIETDLAEIKRQQLHDMQVIASTYERKDVMSATLHSINLQLHTISNAVARLEQR